MRGARGNESRRKRQRGQNHAGLIIDSENDANGGAVYDRPLVQVHIQVNVEAEVIGTSTLKKRENYDRSLSNDTQ